MAIFSFFFFTSPQTLFGREVLFYSCESVILSVVLFVCGSVCLWFRDQDYSKSSRPISIKFGMTVGYYKDKVKLVLTCSLFQNIKSFFFFNIHKLLCRWCSKLCHSIYIINKIIHNTVITKYMYMVKNTDLKSYTANCNNYVENYIIFK